MLETRVAGSRRLCYASLFAFSDQFLDVTIICRVYFGQALVELTAFRKTDLKDMVDRVQNCRCEIRLIPRECVLLVREAVRLLLVLVKSAHIDALSVTNHKSSLVALSAVVGCRENSDTGRELFISVPLMEVVPRLLGLMRSYKGSQFVPLEELSQRRASELH
jgi:hypothetical protein